MGRPPPIYPRISSTLNGDLMVNNGNDSNSAGGSFFSNYGVQCDFKADYSLYLAKADRLYYKVSPCCRYRKPACVSLMAVAFLMLVTLSVLYWNYHETMHR